MIRRKGIVNAKELAFYISDLYKSKYSKDISPIKLQKSLYFTFAYWGGFVRKSKKVEAEFKTNKSEYLFDEKIEAWVYGPVVPEVYNCHNLEAHANPNLFLGNEEVQEYINGVLESAFEVSDFKLVEASHLDNCWKNYFDANAERHNNEIPKEEIIEEYANMY